MPDLPHHLLSRDSAIAMLQDHADPIISLDDSGDVSFFNRAALDFAPNLKHERPLGHFLRYPALTEAVRQVQQDGKTRRFDIVVPVPVERAFECEVRRGPDEAVRLVISLRDMTDQRRTERMRVDFVANVSHELRTPLASLMGFVETILGPARDDSAARERFLGIMLAQAKRMSRLIDDLLQLSRIQRNEHVLPTDIVDLAALMDDLTDTLAPMMREKSLDLTIHRKRDQLPVRGDRDELMRLFENLIQNAAKYGADGGRIDIFMDVLPDFAEVSVQDYGAGIPPEHLPRLTERFYRADLAQSRQKGGTGLGLAIVKHIVNRHRGQLAITSHLGEGARFQVRIPLAKSLK